MYSYVARRLLLMLPTLLILSFLIFVLVHLVPGNIVDAMQAARSKGEGRTVHDIELDRATVERLLGLDAPLPVQYGRWIGLVRQQNGEFDGLFQGNWGISWWQKKSVFKLISYAWGVTFELGLMGLAIASLIALPVGMYSALRKDRWVDFAGRSFAIMCISVPGFWLATLIIVLPSIWWGHMPEIMLIRFADNPVGNLKMFFLPAVVLGMGLCGMTTRMTRTMMLEVLRQDYIRTAWSKGLKELVVNWRHALKNAVIPVVTIVGLQMPVLIGGTVIIEQIFGLPGMGRLILKAILSRDHPLIMGLMLVFAIALMTINLLTDLTYALLDPRIRYK